MNMTDNSSQSADADLALDLIESSRNWANLESHMKHLFDVLHKSASYTIAGLCIPTGPDMVFMADVKDAVSTDAVDALEARARAKFAYDGETSRIIFGQDLAEETHALVPDTMETFSVRTGANLVENEMILAHGGQSKFDRDTRRRAELICRQIATVASLFCVGQCVDGLQAELECVTNLNERIMSIAHGISNSLQAVTGYSEMMLIKTDVDPEQKRLLELVVKGARSIQTQIMEIRAARHTPNKPRV